MALRDSGGCSPLPPGLYAYDCNKTHKSRLHYEIKYDLYKITPKITKKNKNLKVGLLRLLEPGLGLKKQKS